MNKSNQSVEKIYISVNEMMQMFSIGRSTALKLGIDSNAKIKLGRRTLYNVEKVKGYMSSLYEISG